MSRIPRMTLIGMYNFDSSIFDGLDLPSGIVKEEVIDSLLLSDGERPVLYMDVGFMKTAIRIWSKKWKSAFEHINGALTASYNPIHNFDRNEEYTDHSSGNAKTEYDASSDSDTETLVSAMNSSSYQPDGKATSDTSSESTTETNDDRWTTHTAHLYGNIGVTKSQEMILDEIDLRTEQNIYDIISEVFSRELLLYEF